MIKVKHPVESCNAMQAASLEQCPVDQRRFQELFYTYGNINYRYHNRAREFNLSLQDYQEWLEGLPENVRKDMQGKGFEACKGVLSFTRYVMEKNDIGLEEYIRQHMDPADYAEFKELVPGV
jgi:hypothetical protein